eukprot:8899021-Prorocentrum_lima.AAC.1
MMIGFIADVIKDELHEEFVELWDNDFNLTIYFPSHFEKDHVKEIVESMYKRLWGCPNLS